jgi:hypothetical protein
MQLKDSIDRSVQRHIEGVLLNIQWLDFRRASTLKLRRPDPIDGFRIVHNVHIDPQDILLNVTPGLLVRIKQRGSAATSASMSGTAIQELLSNVRYASPSASIPSSRWPWDESLEQSTVIPS